MQNVGMQKCRNAEILDDALRNVIFLNLSNPRSGSILVASVKENCFPTA
jgi:hypothetical protein